MTIADRFRLVWTPFLKKKKRIYQAVGLVCPPILGTTGDLTLYVGRQKYTAHQADLIRHPHDPAIHLWLIPRPEKPTSCRAVWKTPLKKVYRDSLTLQPADPCRVHVVFKMGPDLTFMPTPDEIISLERPELVETLLDHLDKTAHRPADQRLVCTFSTWLLSNCLDPERISKQHLERLKHYIYRGQITWALTPFNTHSEFLGMEEMCRCLYSARRLAERFGRCIPTAAVMNNVPAHTASLAMAIAAAGGEFFQMSTNPDMPAPTVGPLFWWELPDQKQLLCHCSNCLESPLLPPVDWPWSDWLSVQVVSQNDRVKGLQVIDQLDWIESHFDWPLCRTGRLEDFAQSVISRDGKKLPVIDHEFIDPLATGLAADARSTALARACKHRLPSAETLSTMGQLSSKAVSEQTRSEIQQAYQRLVSYSEHSWYGQTYNNPDVSSKNRLYTSQTSANNQIPSADKWTKSWNEKAGMIKNAHDAVERIESDAVSRFTRRKLTGSWNIYIVLFNTMSRARSGLVRIKDEQLPDCEFELVDLSTKATVLYERRGGQIEFIAPVVPPCGYLSLQVRPVTQRQLSEPCADWDARMLAVNNDNYSLRFHTAGGLARWYDRSHSHQWCSHKADFPMGTYLYEMPGTDRIGKFARGTLTNCGPEFIARYCRPLYQDMSQFGPVGGAKAKIRQEITGLYARVTVEANCPARKVANRRSGDIRRYRTTFTHYRGRSELYVNMKLIGKRATYAAEAGYAFFPFAVDHPCVMADRIAHVVLPDDELAAQANAAQLLVYRGLRLEDNLVGINFYPLHNPLISIGSPGVYNYDPNTDHKTGIIYANLFNNCWGLNYRQWQSGDFSFDFVMNPTGNDDWDGGLVNLGTELHRPLVAAITTKTPAQTSQSLLEIQPGCIELVTLKPAEFDAGIIIRLWNADVESVKAMLTFSTVRRKDSLWLCDLLERPTRRNIQINKQGQAKVSLKPNQIVTLLLQRG